MTKFLDFVGLKKLKECLDKRFDAVGGVVENLQQIIKEISSNLVTGKIRTDFMSVGDPSEDTIGMYIHPNALNIRNDDEKVYICDKYAEFHTDIPGNDVYLYYADDDQPSIEISYEHSTCELTSNYLSLWREDGSTYIDTNGVRTNKVVIEGGTNTQILTASGELASRITDDDIDKLFT